MYAISVSFDVNPATERVQISRTQMWAGLVQKAENALPFVTAMDECTVLERFEQGLLRRISLRGTSIRERISFTPEVQVLFERIDDPDHGWISNVLSDSDRGLTLTFTFALAFPGVAAGSDEERQRGEEVRASYVSAVAATITEVRRRVSAGEL